MCGGWMDVFRQAGAVARKNKEQLVNFSALVKKHKDMVEAKGFIRQAVEIDKGAAPFLEKHKENIAANEADVRKEAKMISEGIPDADYKALRLGAHLPYKVLLYLSGAASLIGIGTLFVGFLEVKFGSMKDAIYDVKKAAQIIVMGLVLVAASVIVQAIRDRSAVGKVAESVKEARDIAKGEPIVEDDEE